MNAGSQDQKGKPRAPCSLWAVFWLTAASAAVLAIGISLACYSTQVRTSVLNGTASQLLGSRGALLFKSLDTDSNGHLTPGEFGTVVEKLTGEVCMTVCPKIQCLGLRYPLHALLT